MASDTPISDLAGIDPSYAELLDDDCPHCTSTDSTVRGVVHDRYHKGLADPPYDYDPIEHTWRPEVNALRTRIVELEHELDDAHEALRDAVQSTGGNLIVQDYGRLNRALARRKS